MHAGGAHPGPGQRQQQAPPSPSFQAFTLPSFTAEPAMQVRQAREPRNVHLGFRVTKSYRQKTAAMQAALLANYTMYDITAEDIVLAMLHDLEDGLQSGRVEGRIIDLIQERHGGGATS